MQTLTFHSLLTQLNGRFQLQCHLWPSLAETRSDTEGSFNKLPFLLQKELRGQANQTGLSPWSKCVLSCSAWSYGLGRMKLWWQLCWNSIFLGDKRWCCYRSGQLESRCLAVRTDCLPTHKLRYIILRIRIAQLSFETFLPQLNFDC